MPARVLVFGDAHIPSRRDSIPREFYEHIERSNYDMALITGDLVREKDFRDALPSLPRSFIVRGNMDYSGGSYNFHELVQIDELRFLLIHGTQLRPRGNIKQLSDVVDNVDADVAIHGHTHKATIDLLKERLFLNPGTISGATGGWAGRTEASFMELEIQGNNVEVTLYKTDWNVVKTSVIHYRKSEDAMVRVDK